MGYSGAMNSTPLWRNILEILPLNGHVIYTQTDPLMAKWAIMI